MVNFYDKVAKKFGGYAYSNSKPKYSSEYPNGNPEQIFKTKLLELANAETVALDIGCGDGRFAFEICPNFSLIHGVDNSVELIKIAHSKKESLKISNVAFIVEDASKTSFPDNFFDLVFNRRGPTFYLEYFRLLKKYGFYLEIGIGEQDSIDIKKEFGRGQNYGNWSQPRLPKDREMFTRIGFKIIFTQDFKYTEYYESINELNIFLQGVPIFEDYNSFKDKHHLESYASKFQTPKGILLTRHRVVYVIQKDARHMLAPRDF